MLKELGLEYVIIDTLKEDSISMKPMDLSTKAESHSFQFDS